MHDNIVKSGITSKITQHIYTFTSKDTESKRNNDRITDWRHCNCLGLKVQSRQCSTMSTSIRVYFDSLWGSTHGYLPTPIVLNYTAWQELLDKSTSWPHLSHDFSHNYYKARPFVRLSVSQSAPYDVVNDFATKLHILCEILKYVIFKYTFLASNAMFRRTAMLLIATCCVVCVSLSFVRCRTYCY